MSEDVAQMEEMRNMYKILVGRHDRNKSLGRSGFRPVLLG
jgi:hypothetical protein